MSDRGSDDGDVYRGGISEDERASQCNSESVVADAELARSTSVDAENDDSNTPDAMQGVVYTGDSTLRGAATRLRAADSNDDQVFQGQIGRSDNQVWREVPLPDEASGFWERLEERMAKLSLAEQEEKEEEEKKEEKKEEE
ncbi:hypothetical protein NHJ6243_010164 [Beauveria neobassiana]